MDIMELGAIGELVGGTAVIATLVYLALQIRQDAHSTRSLAAQGMINGQAQSLFLLATDEDLARIVRVGWLDDAEDSLSPGEWHRCSSYLVGFYVQVDFAYHQHLAGRLDESVWNRMADEIPLFFTRGMKRWWEQDKPRFSPEFVAFVEEKIANESPREIVPTLVRDPSDTRPKGDA